MDNYQKSVLALVGSLALVSSWRAQHIQHVWTILSTNPGFSGPDLKTEAKPLGIDLLGVAVLTFIAGLSDDAGKMTVALAVGLWLLYLMSSHKQTSTTWGATGSAFETIRNALQQKGYTS